MRDGRQGWPGLAVCCVCLQRTGLAPSWAHVVKLGVQNANGWRATVDVLLQCSGLAGRCVSPEASSAGHVFAVLASRARELDHGRCDTVDISFHRDSINRSGNRHVCDACQNRECSRDARHKPSPSCLPPMSSPMPASPMSLPSHSHVSLIL